MITTLQQEPAIRGASLIGPATSAGTGQAQPAAAENSSTNQPLPTSRGSNRAKRGENEVEHADPENEASCAAPLGLLAPRPSPEACTHGAPRTSALPASVASPNAPACSRGTGLPSIRRPPYLLFRHDAALLAGGQDFRWRLTGQANQPDAPAAVLARNHSQSMAPPAAPDRRLDHHCRLGRRPANWPSPSINTRLSVCRPAGALQSRINFDR